MDYIDDEFNNYWETNMFLQSEELDCYLDDPYSTYYDSSSPDGNLASKNIVSERNRRKTLNERLYALRSVVPNITKMDKASIIKDAIEYIKSLNEEEKRIQEEISELESGSGGIIASSSNTTTSLFNFDQEDCSDHDWPINNSNNNHCNTSRMECCYDFSASGLMSSPIEVLELRVSKMGDKMVVVSLTCSQRSDTMVKLCEMFESMELKIITSNITAFSGRLFTTVFLEADEEEKDALRVKIESAIATSNEPNSPISN